MRALLLAVVIATAAPAAAGSPATDLAAAFDAYAAGRFDAARRGFADLAARDSAIAETMLGTMYAHGQGVRADPAAAAGYYFRAAQRGYAPAQLAFARALARGAGVAVDRDAAGVWSRLAARSGDARVVAAARHDGMIGSTPADADPQVAEWRPWPTGRD